MLATRLLSECCLLAMVLGCGSSVTVVAEEWPNWMGPRLDGISTETGWSADWPEDGLPQVWQREIGIGFSSVSIVNHRLYTMGHADGQETIWCLDSRTGEVLWTHSYEAELNDNLYEGGPGSTPTIHGDTVYTLGVDGQLLALNAGSGQVIWQKNLQEELDVGLHEWGFNSSPFVLDNQLIVQGGRLVSFDKKSGRKIWQSEKHQAGYGSIRSFEHGDQTLLASLDCDGLRISRANDGSQVAFHEWKSPFDTNSTTPIIQDDMIFVSTGYNVGCGLFQFTGDELTEVYTNKEMRNHFNNSVLKDGLLYGMDGNSNLGRVVTLTCMDFASGEVRWKQKGLGCGSVLVANNKLLILSERGDLVLASANGAGYDELARARILTGRCWTVPVLLDGCVFARNAEGDLVCVRLPAE